MAITTFDTHKFVRRLEEAGVPVKQAEIQADVLTEAFNVNLESLVTKDYLAARFAEQDARWDRRMAELDVKWEQRFARLTAKVDSNFRVFQWTQAIILAAVILPYLERLMAL
ncbi:MAG: hypothetical protein RLZZ385_694 [Pseudomonadota bacterium]|jgi:hypothetical protein